MIWCDAVDCWLPPSWIYGVTCHLAFVLTSLPAIILDYTEVTFGHWWQLEMISQSNMAAIRNLQQITHLNYSCRFQRPHCQLPTQWWQQANRLSLGLFKETTEESAIIVQDWVLFSRMIIKGNKRTLTFDDMPDLMDKDKCHSVHGLFQSSWKPRAQKLPPLESANADLSNVTAMPMLLTLIRASWSPFLISGFLRLIFGLADFLNPLLLQ